VLAMNAAKFRAGPWAVWAWIVIFLVITRWSTLPPVSDWKLAGEEARVAKVARAEAEKAAVARASAATREVSSRVKSETIVANQGEWSDFVQIPPWQEFWWETIGCVKVKNSLGRIYEGESCPNKYLRIGDKLSMAEVKLSFLPLEGRERIKIHWKPK